MISFGGMVTAILASTCCIGPALFLIFGITGLGFLSRFEWMKPYFLVGTFILGCISYHYAYGKGANCGHGGGCNPHSRRINRVLFWVLVGFILSGNFYLFFISGRYYYFHDDPWFWALGYGGPWVHVGHKYLPPGLLKHKIQQLHAYRDREFNLYKVQGSKYKGKQFPIAGGSNRGPSCPHFPFL